MPRRIFSNTQQPLRLEDWFLGETERLCVPIQFPVGEVPAWLHTLTLAVQRREEEDQTDEVPVGGLECWLGTSWFGQDLGLRTARPDWIDGNETGTLKLSWRIALPSLVDRTVYLTLLSPAARRLFTGHVAEAGVIFGAGRAQGFGEEYACPPLWLEVEGDVIAESSTAELLADVRSFDQADHGWFSAALAGSVLRKKSRITVWSPDFTLNTPPFTRSDQLPRVEHPVVLHNVQDYTVTRTDQFVSAKLTLRLLPAAYAYHRDLLQVNALITVDEQWKSGTETSGWLRRGTFLLDAVPDQEQSGERLITLEARDVLKMLMVSEVQQRFAPDRIWMKRRRLHRIRNGGDGLGYHVFVDGRRRHHTVLWVDQPLVKLWKGNRNRDGQRIYPAAGSVDLIHRSGELLIEKEYYRSGAKYGGLGDPDWIDAEYYRHALPADESPDLRIATLVERAQYTELTVEGGNRRQWRGTTLEVTSGDARGQRYGVSKVENGKLHLYRRYLGQEGVAVGDTVRIVTANRVEEVVRRVLLHCGFQEIDPNQPFYLQSILAPPTDEPILIPGEEFDFRFGRAKSGYAILQQLGFWIPPNTQYRANALGNIETVILDPAQAPRYVWDSPTGQQFEQSDQDLYTQVVYRVRNRRRANLLSYTSGALKEATVHADFITGTRNLLQLIRLYPKTHLRNLTNKRERVRRAVTDGRMATGAIWDLQISWRDGVVDEPPANARGLLDNRVLLTWELHTEHRLAEIHIRAPRSGWITKQYLEIEYSRDGVFWETATDEFTFSSKNDNYQQFTLPENSYGRFIRVRSRTAARRSRQVGKSTPGGPVKVTSYHDSVGIGDVFVYADEIVEGTATLGIHRLSDGATEGVPADEIALAQRLGRRTLVVEPIDERGYELSMGLGFARLDEYAFARALEFLNEGILLFTGPSVRGVRPDLNIGDMVTLPARPGVPAASYLVRATRFDSDGSVRADLVDFRYNPVSNASEITHPTTDSHPWVETAEVSDADLLQEDHDGDLDYETEVT